MSAWTYIPNFFDDLISSQIDHDVVMKNIFDYLKHGLEWVRHENVPRCEYYWNRYPVPYTYGKPEYARTYYPQRDSIEITGIRFRLQQLLKCEFDVCFLNMYLDQRDHLGWHSDDSPEMDDERPIVSVSLGATREIQIREIGSANVESITLESGSAFIMHPGVQDTHQHRIPKSGRVVGERISLTFRGYKHDTEE